MDMNSLSHTKWECKYHIVFSICMYLNINDLKTRKEVLQWYIDMNFGGTPVG